MTAHQVPAGVKLGVDVGLVRVGLASCDAGGLLATPVRTLRRDVKKNTDVRLLVQEARERAAVQIFVGLPRTLKGDETGSAAMARGYAALLLRELAAQGLAVPVRLIDERLSTVSAHRSLREAGLSTREHRKVVDQVAAVGILQQAIDMQRSLGRDVGVPAEGLVPGSPHAPEPAAAEPAAEPFAASVTVQPTVEPVAAEAAAAERAAGPDPAAGPDAMKEPAIPQDPSSGQDVRP